MTTKRSPTTSELVRVIDELIAGKRPRQDVANWAHQLYSDADLIHSEKVADTLESLGAVDLVGGDRSFLYTESDFVKWRAALAKGDDGDVDD